MNAKQLAAEKAVSFLDNGMTIGLGTGSTAYWAIEKIGEKVKKEGWNIKAIATSVVSEEHARGLGIPIFDFSSIKSIDVTIDGADEVNPKLQLIKGGGGALLREKIVATNSKQMIVSRTNPNGLKPSVNFLCRLKSFISDGREPLINYKCWDVRQKGE